MSENPVLSYKVYGSGKKRMLAFHGFGQDASLFEQWQDAFTEYTIYSFDLFFHGESRWTPPSLKLTPQEWREIMKEFLQEKQISNFSIAAFSLGGRVALSTMLSFREQVEKVYLIAPDGIKSNFWYQFSTKLHTMRFLFRCTVEHPYIFDGIRNFVKKSNIVNKSLIRLAENQMGDEKLRRRVYNTWMSYRLLKARPRKISGALNQHKIETYIFTGKFDRLIPSDYLRKFAGYIENCYFREIDCGHFKLPTEVAALKLRGEIN